MNQFGISYRKMPETAETNSVSSNDSISRRQEHNIVKELHDIFNKFLSLLIAVVLLMNSDSGKALFQEYNSALKGAVLASALLFLLCILVTLFQKHFKNFLPIIILLLLQSVICVLCLSVISLAIAVIALVLWLCVFGLIALFKFPELCQLVVEKIQSLCQLVAERIQSWIVGSIPQSPPLTPEIPGHQRSPSPATV